MCLFNFFKHVDSHIFKSVISEAGLLGSKTRILVTHGIHHLPSVDDIVLIKNGKIHEHGTFEELVNAKGDFSHLANLMMADDQKMKDEEVQEAELREKSIGSKKSSIIISKQNSKAIVEPAAETTGLLTTDEDQGVGSAGISAYLQYATAFSIPGFIICIFLLLTSNALSAWSSWWLGIWSSASPIDQTRYIVFYFGGYVGIVALFAIANSIVTYLFRAVYALR
jgi:ATP-binding cassette, subfamily C (CFTR/MRP), member 1